MERRGRILLGVLGIALLLSGALISAARHLESSTRAARARAEPVEAPAQPQPGPAVPAGARWTIAGAVLGADGAPIVDASVVVVVEVDPEGEPGMATTDGAGRYEVGIAALESGPWAKAYVRATAPGHQPGSSRFRIDLSDETRRSACDLVLQRGACVGGRIVDTSGRPIAGAEVHLYAAGRGNVVGIAAPTGRDGRFLIGAPRGGPHGINARAKGYREALSGLIDIPEDKDLDVGDIVLPEGLVVEGHVRYADGQPVGGAQLWLAIEGLRWGDTATTADDGSFRAGGLDHPHRRVALSGWLGTGAPETAFEAPARDVLLTVPGGRVRLRIVDANGDLLPDARYLALVGSIGPATASGWIPLKATGGKVSHFARPGTHLFFVAEAEGRIPAEQAFDVPADRNESEVVLRLVPIAATGRLRIDSNAPRGTPFVARLQTGIARRHVATLNHDGSGTPVLDAPPGAWHMVIQPQDSTTPYFDPAEMDVVIRQDEETTVRVDTPAGGRVRLEVRATAHFMAGFKGRLVRAEDGAEIAIKQFLERPGAPPSYTLDANRATLVGALLRPGMYGVHVELPGHEPYEETIRVDALAVTDVVAEMVRQKE